MRTDRLHAVSVSLDSRVENRKAPWELIGILYGTWLQASPDAQAATGGDHHLMCRESTAKSRIAHRVLIAGGGVAALEAALALRRLAEERVDIELLAPETHFWYRPLAVLEPFGGGRVHELELAELAEDCGARFTLGALGSVDTDAHVAETSAGAEIEYDSLLVAAGARPIEAICGALTFRGPADTNAFRELLDQVEEGRVRRLVFALPGGVVWPLPLYELALQTSAYLHRRGVVGVELALVTHEDSPLALFGARASEVVARLLEEAGIVVQPHRYAVAVREEALSLVPSGEVPADRVVALPRLAGSAISGVAHDDNGFIPIDPHCRISGADDLYAAGDATTFPIKQGGLAAQQADAAAQVIAAAAGAALTPEPFRPVLRGLLITGREPAFVRAELGGGRGETSATHTEALWWPPGKIVGRYLAPFLADRAGIVLEPAPEGVAVDVALRT
jgi:sulfide:quinone oxidoreductase